MTDTTDGNVDRRRHLINEGCCFRGKAFAPKHDFTDTVIVFKGFAQAFHDMVGKFFTVV